MFMSFKCCDGNGQPQGQRICVNMRKVENIMEMGQWTAVPHPDQDDEMFFQAAMINNPFDAPPRPHARPQRPVARPHTPDTFVVTPNCIQLVTQQQTYIVIANFDELSKMLESLNNMYEET